MAPSEQALIDQLRAAAAGASQSVRERDRLIIALRRRGVPLRTIGAAANLSATRIMQIADPVAPKRID